MAVRGGRVGSQGPAELQPPRAAAAPGPELGSTAGGATRAGARGERELSLLRAG